MGLLQDARRGVKSLFSKPASLPLSGEGKLPAYWDTLSVIHDLSRLVRNDPEALDVYMALGNLFRAQGDIERAVKIREGLIVRPDLPLQFKSRSYFELGRDYQRSGILDRALSAYREAENLGYPADEVRLELANLYAHTGDFEKAAEQYGGLQHSLAQAHYLVLQAEEFLRNGEDAKAQKLIKKALRIYPGSVEGWCAMVCIEARSRSWRKTRNFLERAFARIEPRLQFLLLDSLLEMQKKTYSGDPALNEDARVFAIELCNAVIPVIEAQEPNILLHYYGALLLERAQDIEAVDAWLTKALVVQPNFWAARLRALALSVRKGETPPVVELQTGYLVEELGHIKRFACTTCGFRENQAFYRCRRCGSWHSLAYRLSLQE